MTKENRVCIKTDIFWPYLDSNDVLSNVAGSCFDKIIFEKSWNIGIIIIWLNRIPVDSFLYFRFSGSPKGLDLSLIVLPNT